MFPTENFSPHNFIISIALQLEINTIEIRTVAAETTSGKGMTTVVGVPSHEVEEEVEVAEAG